MNINNLRKNYKTLNKIERNSLFLSAVLRKDKSEESAILSASPSELREMPDFTHLYQKVLSLQMIVLIYKADAWTNWQLFSQIEGEKAEQHSRLALYYFFVFSDAWTAVCEQLNIDADKLAEMTFPDCFLIWRIAFIDDGFRQLAFTEAEARDFIGWFAGKKARFEITLKNKIAEFREFLDLPKK
jgi:hypothetical protein